MKTFAEQLKEHNAYTDRTMNEIRDLITAIKKTHDPKATVALSSKADELIASLEHNMQDFDAKHITELKALKEYLESKKEQIK
ncbi:MAG: hypothetical protein Q8R55_08095 [Candidatus Taylorbacteria bacterium]|nr:hypothetical protein [Candidatus Taylorbacteria bacterium]